MKKIFFLFLLFVLVNIPIKASVDFGATWVQPMDYVPACLGNQYVEVGFWVNWEFNNASFEIQRSTDPGFSWAITVGNLSGCGTCGTNMYSINDYGQFAPYQVWHYQVKATSNNVNFQYKYLGYYTTNIPTTVNWINQVPHSVTTGSSPFTESSYIWAQEPRDGQGVNISLMSTEITKIYLEQGNNKIHFIVQQNTPFIAIDVNVDNGGYYNIYNGSSQTGFNWTNSSNDIYSLGAHNLKVKFTAMGGNQYLREYEVFVVPKSDAYYRDNYCNTMRVWKGANPTNPIPLILSEGFDAYNSKSEQYYRYAGKDLMDCLLLKGFDIYVINYSLNAQSIKNNAAVFQSAVRYISNLYGGKLVTATGMSMGGVINRYACAKAESDGNPLPISKMMSIDAPHQEAIVSDSLQIRRKGLLDLNAQNGFPDPFSEFQANNDAAKELLKFNAYDPSGTVHTNFLNDLNTINSDGYPHLVETIGVAFSTNTPNPNSGTWLTLSVALPPNGNQATVFSFNLRPDELVAGSYLPPVNIDPTSPSSPKTLEGLGLSFLRSIYNPWVITTQTKDPTFIPYTSALDIVNGVSKFDRVIVPSVTGYHDVIPSQLVDSIVNALIEKNVYVQNKTYSNTVRTIVAGERIFAGRNVTNTIAQGDVIINSTSNIKFKAGKEIKIDDGFSVNPGGEFTAIITPVQCDGSVEYQERTALYNDMIESESKAIETYDYQADETAEPAAWHEVYPNPTSGSVYITRLGNDIEYSYSIVSLQGEILRSGVLFNSNEISLSDLSSGIYIIRLVHPTSGVSILLKVTKI